VPLTVAKDLLVTMTRKARKDMKVTVSYDKPAPAPIKQGTPLGKIVISAPDTATVEVPLVAGATVERLGPFGRMAMVAGHLIWGKRHWARPLARRRHAAPCSASRAARAPARRP